jgi:hypothetical protein
LVTRLGQDAFEEVRRRRAGGPRFGIIELHGVDKGARLVGQLDAFTAVAEPAVEIAQHRGVGAVMDDKRTAVAGDDHEGGRGQDLASGR